MNLVEIPDDVFKMAAQIIRDGFDRHYDLFRTYCAKARQCFENGEWQKASQINRERIESYELRVDETVEALEKSFESEARNSDAWPRIKRAYIGQLMDHLQAECAETFYNSVACRVLRREYYNNDHIFWRPVLSTEHLDGSQPSYRGYYPGKKGMRRCLLAILTRPGLNNPFENLRGDVRRLERAIRKGQGRKWKRESNYQVHILSSLFFRNKAAYIVGRTINGDVITPFVIPLLQNDKGELFADTLIDRRKDSAILFSFARAYFFVDMEAPSAYVKFLRSFMPGKSMVDLYAMLGLQKQAKTLFYRGLQYHLDHSRDHFEITPGIPGMVMLVFYLPSHDFVFKVIRDKFAPPKAISREEVKEKYHLVKMHDRVGRMADTLEYSNVAIPINRIDPDLLEQLRSETSLNIEIDDDLLILRHVYIERRMEPLDQYLVGLKGGRRKRAIREYGQAIKDLVSANIFPGDMFKKNFGVTRTRRVVFYDYDEICYVTDCNFRKIPPARDYMDEMAPSGWYSTAEDDVFPETFGPYFFAIQKDLNYFKRYHGELLEANWWKAQQEEIRNGRPADIFPYRQKIRFERR